MMAKSFVSSIAALALLCGCAPEDSNSKPVYGEGTGLPVNCRAYVQAAIDGYRIGRYTADEAMTGLERNCGIAGISWGQSKN